MEIHVFESKEYAEKTAQFIAAHLSQLIEEREECSISLCGGTTPGEVFTVISERASTFDPPLNWQALKIFFGDERFVAEGDDRSNCKMVRETLLSNPSSTEARFFPIPTPEVVATPAEAAQKYSDTLQKNLDHSKDGIPVIDILLLGIGEDGHIASLFPHQKELFEREKLCISCTHPTDGTERISLSFAMLEAAHHIYFLVKGESKKEILEKVLSWSTNLSELPASFYNLVSHKVCFLIDKGAQP